jgi:hypothetical protein
MDPYMWCIIVPIIMIVLIFVKAAADRKAIEAARYAYQEALTDLKKHPADPNKKQHALTLGRTYSNLTRNKRGVTIFDEMAVMNDLNAATAHAYQAAPSPTSYVPPTAPAAYTPASSTQTLDPAERLRKLDDLKTQGLINAEEHAARRAKILEDL